MTMTAAEFPNDIETLKALVLAARSETAALAAEAWALRAAKACWLVGASASERRP